MRNIARLAGILTLLTPVVASAAPVVIPEGVAEPVVGQGTGLCAASAVSMNGVADFGSLTQMTYSGSMNAFIEAHKAERVESVVRTPLDLSNNNAAGLKTSHGDFVDASLPQCQTGGCDFFLNDTTTSFGMRLRGYFNVTADLANKPIHFGLFTDDAVSLTFYGVNGKEFPIVARPPTIGLPAWRITEEVRFQKPGLYPLEILYIEIAEHAALEMSYFIGPFADFERSANQPPIVKLNEAGFTLFTPTSFFQTVTGNPSFPDLNVCQQCDRAHVNVPGNNDCATGYYCNDAALCAPCASNKLCGPTCSPCGGNTPHCENIENAYKCVECRADVDCLNGGTCDTTTHTCNGSSSNGAGGDGGNGASNGAGGNGGGPIPNEGGCSCRTASTDSPSAMSAMFGLVGIGWGLLFMRRRNSDRRSRRQRLMSMR